MTPFNRKLDGKKSSSYFVRTGLTNKIDATISISVKERYIWAKQSDKLNDGICYKTHVL